MRGLVHRVVFHQVSIICKLDVCLAFTIMQYRLTNEYCTVELFLLFKNIISGLVLETVVIVYAFANDSILATKAEKN